MQMLYCPGLSWRNLTEATFEVESTLTDRYQTTVPDPVRRALRLGKRDRIHCAIRPNGEVVLTRVEPAQDDPLLGQFLGFLARAIKKQLCRTIAASSVRSQDQKYGMLPQFMATSSIKSPYFLCYQAAQVKLGDRGFLSRDITAMREELVKNLRMNCIPETMLDGEIKSYAAFLDDRRKLMALKIKTWFEALG